MSVIMIFFFQDHCYYHGQVEGEPKSTVAFSTCFGLRGVFTLDGVSYALEPMEEGKHLLYRLENLKLNGSVCGVSSDNHIFVETDSPVGFLLRRKRALLVDTRYIELLLVVENKKFVQFYQKDHQKLIAALAELTNTMDAHFKPLNIRVIPVDGVILSAGEDEVVIGQRESAGAVLGRFAAWRQNNITKLKRNDAALLMTENVGSTLGMAFVSTVCSDSHSGGIAALKSNIMLSAAIASHELGHVLGIGHDGRDCSSPSGPYIMSATFGGTIPTQFSSCSENNLENLLVVKKSGSCLRNQPEAGEGLRPQECGNNMLEVGEECDCGKPEDCSNICCNANSCKLKEGSQCASGLCCKDCKFIPQSFQCRPYTEECDFPEYCDGLSSTCPSNTFAQNGQPCANNSAYCYSGVCQTLTKQCQDIWGGDAKAASDACFEKVNTKGNEFGNCGQQGKSYTACSKGNAKCGKLICSDTPTHPLILKIPGIVHYGDCTSVHFDYGSDVPDPGMVQPGTKVGEDLVCFDYMAQSYSILNYDCNATVTCNNHGLCNNNKNCHCDPGYAPPDCVNSGCGGSIDSGPACKDDSKNNMLFLLFLLIPGGGGLGWWWKKRSKCPHKSSQQPHNQEIHVAHIEPFPGVAPSAPARPPPPAAVMLKQVYNPNAAWEQAENPSTTSANNVPQRPPPPPPHLQGFSHHEQFT
uniref:disintegrin and metalloproteinase domain-containing protein 9-like isoform X3 n=1 Tax=Myxine glutinosa TaxID=7769 RepID=UPI00358EC2BA